TGEFIDKAAVVTLLGTIAGYIFARPSRAAAPAAANTPPPVSPPASASTSPPVSPPAPTNLQTSPSPGPGQASVSCNPVPGAIAYRWYTKLQSATGDPVFREQTTEPHVVFSGFQTGEKVVIAVTATTN